jgi:hypothetical protein
MLGQYVVEPPIQDSKVHRDGRLDGRHRQVAVRIEHTGIAEHLPCGGAFLIEHIGTPRRDRALPTALERIVADEIVEFADPVAERRGVSATAASAPDPCSSDENTEEFR